MLAVFAVLLAVGCATASAPENTVRIPISGAVEKENTPNEKDSEEVSLKVHKFLKQSPDWKGARLFEPFEIKSNNERDWYEKNGYKSTVVFDMDFDDATQIASVVVLGERLYLLILKVEGEKMAELYRQLLNVPQALLRFELMPGISRSMCVIATAGPHGPRTIVCWNGQKFTGVSI